MIKVIVKEDKYINSIKITGHANYNEYGKDIVCAAVSSICLTTCNGIMSLEDTIKCNEKSGLLEISVMKNTDVNQKLLINMLDMLEELKGQYPKNIEIRNEE